MENTIKFTEQEILEINELKKNVSEVFYQLGQLNLERKKRLEELDLIESDLHNKYFALTQEEQSLFQKLNEKYGDGSYDLNTGLFTPSNDIKNTNQ
jgi:hypothetical protein